MPRMLCCPADIERAALHEGKRGAFRLVGFSRGQVLTLAGAEHRPGFPGRWTRAAYAASFPAPGHARSKMAREAAEQRCWRLLQDAFFYMRWRELAAGAQAQDPRRGDAMRCRFSRRWLPDVGHEMISDSAKLPAPTAEIQQSRKRCADYALGKMLILRFRRKETDRF